MTSKAKMEQTLMLGKKKFSRFAGKFFLYVMLLSLSYVFLYPILYMFITSIKDMSDMMDRTVNWIPNRIMLKNYTVALSIIKFEVGFKNSVVITLLSTLGHVTAASFIGYGFARYKFPGVNLLFAIVILNIIIPTQVIIVPLFYQFTQIFNLMDSNLPIIIPTFFGYGLRGGLYIFLFRQFFMNLPKELEESASIDGCGKIGTHFRIILPISVPVTLVCVVLSMVWHWNDHFEPMVYLFTPPKQTLMQSLPTLLLDLQRIMQSIIEGEWGYVPFPREIAELFIREMSLDSVMMAALNICIAPVLLLYVILQKRFVQGIETAGLKA